MGRGIRDQQRSRVYAWERDACEALMGRDFYEPEFKALEECDAFAQPIWRKERGRVGLAGQAAPSIERPSMGQRRAIAHHDHRITLPRWARSRWVVLHEMAHRLTPRDEAHGPRFVGVLIGLLARWCDLDAAELMRLADAGGVRYHVRSVGLVPVHGTTWHVARALQRERPMTAMDLACWLSIGTGVVITPPQVRGAALVLIRAGRARWLRGRLHPLGDLVPAPAPAPRPAARRAPSRTPLQRLRDRAAPHGITVEADGPASYWVTCTGRFPVDECDDDPLQGDHWAGSYAEAVDKIDVYVAALAGDTRAA